MAEEPIPKGVLAVYVHEGRVIAHASDFNRSTPGGYTMLEAQEYRAKQSLARAVVRELSSPLLYNNIDLYECEKIMRDLPGKAHLIPVGYSDASAKVTQE